MEIVIRIEIPDGSQVASRMIPKWQFPNSRSFPKPNFIAMGAEQTSWPRP